MYERGVLRSLLHREMERRGCTYRVLRGDRAILSRLAHLAGLCSGTGIIATVVIAHCLLVRVRRLHLRHTTRLLHRAWCRERVYASNALEGNR